MSEKPERIVFGGGAPDRAAGVAPPRRRPAAVPAADVAPVAAPAVVAGPEVAAGPLPVPGAAAVATAAAPRARRGRRRAPREDAGTGVYVSADVRKRLRLFAAEHERTFTDVVLDAIDARADVLRDLLAPQSSVRRDSLFQGRERRRRQHHDAVQVQVTIRCTPHDLVVLNEIERASGAANRSHLIQTALDAYLPRLDDEEGGAGR